MKTEEMIVKMVNLLMEMSTDNYMRSKYMIMSCCNNDSLKPFYTGLFKRVEDRRPKLLEMKGGATA